MRQNNGLYVSCPACGDEESEAHGRLALLRTLCISVLFTMPLMWSLRPLIQFLLATVVQFWPGMYFYKGAYRALRQKILGMDFLVALSTTIIYAYSAYITFTVYHNTKLYFLSECVLLSLILFGKYMETTSRYEASAAIRRLINLQPETAHILRGGAEIEVGLNDILPSDSIVIRSGDHIPIDCVISDGECLADESMLTGESEPIRKQPGDTLYCGTLCRDGQVLLSCGSIGKTTMLQQIIDIVSNAQSEKAPIARLADKIATVFVPIVVLIAAAVFCRWYFFADKGNLAQAVNCVCATLVIACPCALGLATPVAIMVGSGVGAKNGILFKTAASLEETGRTQIVVLDKTGTITTGQPEITDLLPADGVSEDELLRFAAALENKSEHPLSRAILNGFAFRGGECPEAENFAAVPGRGLTAKIEGYTVCGGNADFIREKAALPESITQRAAALADKGKTPLYFSRNNELLGVIAVADVMKSDAAEAIRELKGMGLRVVMLTGDNARTAAAIGSAAGVDAVVAGVLPDGKEAVIRKLRESGKVAMVGDGINDAPALKRAHVGIAMGGVGSDIAVDAADIALVDDEVKELPHLIALSKRMMRTIKLNITFSLTLNFIAIVLAIIGTLNPDVGALVHNAGSVLVITNSALLLKWRQTALAEFRVRRREI